MPLFSYEALDSRGRRCRGEIEADSDREARRQLKGNGLVLRKLVATTDSAKRQGGDPSKALGANETVSFLQQLATLLDAGMPVAEALQSIAGGMESERARRTVAGLRQQVLEGTSLANAMSSYGFDETVRNMVAAGEETGQLQAVSERLAEVMEHQMSMNQQVLSAVLYPAIVTGFGFLILIFLLVVVMPQVVGVFEHSGAKLPWVTQALITLSGWVQAYGLLMILAALLLVVGFVFAMRVPSLRQRRDAFLLALPMMGKLLTKIQTARFARTLGMLLTGGVPVLSALHIANQSLTILPIRAAAMAATEGLREGGSLAELLQASGYFPHMATSMMAVGEQSGRLDVLLIKVADTFDDEAGRSLKRMVVVLEPMLVIAMAIMVGSMAMAILLPIMEMNQLVR
ncbi:MAG: type II secretion system F family protein [Mariprofundaceae bacterium]